LSRVEAELGLSFPPEYLAFISQHNGGKPAHNVFYTPPDNASGIHGIIPLDKVLDEHKVLSDRKPGHIVPIMFDAFGNYVCLDLSSRGRGSVYFLDHERRPPESLTYLAPGLNAFFEDVLPFDHDSVPSGAEKLAFAADLLERLRRRQNWARPRNG
jgi:hypothetical protein